MPHPAHRRPVRSKRTRRQPRRSSSGVSNFITVVVAAIFVGGLSFAAVVVDWPALLGSAEAMTVEHAKAMGMQLSGKPSSASFASLEAIDRKAAAITSLAIVNGRAQAKLAGKPLRFEAPKGHCFLDAEQPGDARLYNVLQRVFRGDIRMLNGYADCKQLNAWRAGERTSLDNYGNFLVPIAMLERTAEGPAKPLVETICATMREQAGEFRPGNTAGLKGRFEKALESARINQMRLLGVVDQDENACYFGLLQKIQTEKNEIKTQMDVTAVTFIGGKMLYINLYAELEKDTTLRELLARQKASVARNIALNSE